jgi:hypothetical protein
VLEQKNQKKKTKKKKTKKKKTKKKKTKKKRGKKKWWEKVTHNQDALLSEREEKEKRLIVKEKEP